MTRGEALAIGRRVQLHPYGGRSMAERVADELLKASDGSLAEFVREVSAWHVEHFGRQPMDVPLADKLVEEAAEFREAVKQGGMFEEEAADCLIVLCAYAGRVGFDLLREARKKLEKVKQRDQIARDKERGIIPSDFVRADG